MSFNLKETDQSPLYSLSTRHSTVQFKVPFMLGSAVYGSFGRFHVDATWSEHQLLPQTLSIFLDSSSINANFIEPNDAEQQKWSSETKVKLSELFLETEKQSCKMPLGEALCRFNTVGHDLSMDLEFELERASWNRLRGLDSNVKGLFNSGPVVLLIHLTWNSMAASHFFIGPFSEIEYPRIMKVANGMM